MAAQEKPVRSRTSEMVIRKTTYIVTTTFSEGARETVEQKLIRYVADHIACDLCNADTGLTAVEK